MKREALVLALMAELAAGRESRWAPYLVRDNKQHVVAVATSASLTPSVSVRPRLRTQAALPALSELHVPVGWSAEASAALRGTSAAARLAGGGGATDELPTATRRAWEALGAPLAASAPELRLTSGAAGRAAHAHATALVAAYSFSLGSAGAHQALVPFWDALNHAHPHAASVRLHHDAARGRLEMVTVRAVAAGAEVFNTYGPLGTSELVRRYGFAAPLEEEEGNPHDCAEVSGGALRRAAAAAGVAARDVRVGARLARQAGLLPRFARFRVPSDGAPPAVLLLALRTLCAGAAAAADAAACLRRAQPPPPLAGAPARRTAATLRAALTALATHAAARMPHTAAEARRRLLHAPRQQPTQESVRASLALRVVLAEQSALDAMCRWARDAPPRALLLRAEPADALAETALWRRGVHAAAMRSLLAARRKRPRAPDLTSPRVLRVLCLARAVRFRPPHAKRRPRAGPAAAAAADVVAAPLPPAAPGVRCCRDARCRDARCGTAGPFSLPQQPRSGSGGGAR
jgi:hypothetical protein